MFSLTLLCGNGNFSSPMWHISWSSLQRNYKSRVLLHVLGITGKGSIRYYRANNWSILKNSIKTFFSPPSSSCSTCSRILSIFPVPQWAELKSSPCLLVRILSLTFCGLHFCHPTCTQPSSTPVGLFSQDLHPLWVRDCSQPSPRRIAKSSLGDSFLHPSSPPLSKTSSQENREVEFD